MDLSAPSLRICLIDDDPDHILLITHAIRRADKHADVHTVDDGARALTYLKETATLPDLVLLDINMPGLSGLDVLQTIKQQPSLRRIPVVMLTSSDLPSDVERAYELGASGYITKPLHQHDLQAVLGNALLYWSSMQRAAPARGGLA